jgi:hypothetical protein
MGGTKIVQPTPPAAPTPGQSAKEFAAALPDILAAQLEFQPQFDQAAFESFQELAPQFARVSRQVLEETTPTLASLDEELAKQALEQSTVGLSQEERDIFKEQFKSLTGTQVSSGLGGEFVGRNLALANLQARQAGQNLALSLQGKVPVSQAFQQPAQFQVASAFQPAFGTQAQTFGSVFAGAGRPLGFETGIQRFGQIAGGIGGLLQGVGSLGRPA